MAYYLSHAKTVDAFAMTIINNDNVKSINKRTRKPFLSWCSWADAGHTIELAT